MKLQAGLSAPSPGWQLFLDQEKIPVKILPAGRWNREETPVVILTGAGPVSSALLKDFLKQGGRVVIDRRSRSAIKDLGEDADFFFRVDADVAADARNWRSAVKTFNQGTAFPVTEITAIKPKRLTREAVVQALQKAFWAQGLPYGHLDYYPEGIRSVFSFRFDFDEYDPHDFTELCRLLSAYRGSITCFPCMKTYEPFLKELGRAAATGVEFGSHAYVHHIYPSYRQNDLNLARAEELLRKVIPEVKGFSGPHGTWHPSLQRVLENRGYTYSSEFSLDYDNLPFFPLLDNRPSTVLQIPAHAVCEGVFLQSYPYREDIFKDYYDRIIEERFAARHPVILFGHPTRRLGRYPQILHNIYKAADRHSGLWKTEFRTYSTWWKARHETSFTAEWKGAKGLSLLLENSAAAEVTGAGKLVYRLLFAGGQVQTWVLGDRNPARTETLAAAALPGITAALENGERVSFSFMKILKLALKRWLDWETKTPLSILKITGVSSAFKFLMRCLYDASRPRNKTLTGGMT